MTPPARRPLSRPAPVLAVADTNQWMRSEALNQWNALADREGQSIYEIELFTFLSIENRSTIADWCYKVADCLVIERRVVSIAFSHFDRYLSHHEENKNDCWLVILACLQLAIKLHSNKNETSLRPILLNLRTICRFSERQVAEKELYICEDLQWYLNPPVPAMYLEVATPLIDAIINKENVSITKAMTHDIVELSRFLMELGVYDLRLSGERPSSVAYAAILVAMNHLHIPTRTVNKWLSLTLNHSSYKTDRCIQWLQRILTAIHGRTSLCSSPTNVGGNFV